MIPALLLAACTTGKDDTGEVDYVLDLTVANNWTYTGALEIDTVEVELAADVQFSWGGLTEDIQGHEMDPTTDVDYSWLIWYQYLDLPQLEEAINCDGLVASDVEIGVYNEPEFADGTTSVWLSELYIPPGNPFLPDEYFVYTDGVWFARLTTGQNFTRRMVAVVPTAESTNHLVEYTNTTSSLRFDADLQTLTPFEVEPTGPYSVDWSDAAAAENGCEEPTDLEKADQLWLARYEGYSLPEIEAQVLDLEYTYAELYTAPAYGIDELDLSEASNEAGEAFPGFGTDSFWLLALRCTTCDNPAPLYLTVLNGKSG